MLPYKATFLAGFQLRGFLPTRCDGKRSPPADSTRRDPPPWYRRAAIFRVCIAPARRRRASPAAPGFPSPATGISAYLHISTPYLVAQLQGLIGSISGQRLATVFHGPPGCASVGISFRTSGPCHFFNGQASAVVRGPRFAVIMRAPTIRVSFRRSSHTQHQRPLRRPCDHPR